MKTIPVGAIQTFTGGYFSLTESGPEDIHIEDIAHSLSMQCRYNGHTRKFYSVAEHCVLIAQWILAQGHGWVYALEGLLHDSAEAYLCDIPRPFKRQLANYKELEQRVERLVARRFGLEYPWRVYVKHADNRILVDEQQQLMVYHEPNGIHPLGVVIQGLSPAAAERAFLKMWDYLTGPR